MHDDDSASYHPIATPHGVPQGRDAIHLAEIKEEVCPRELRLSGSFEGLVEGASVPFSLRFAGLLELHAIELDFSDFHGRPCFVEVSPSPRVAELRRRDHSSKIHDPHHYFLRTYDEVFEVICAGYELTLSEPLPHRMMDEAEAAACED